MTKRTSIRDRLAEKLMAELDQMGINYKPFTGDDLIPVSGYWKSQDCYRWESVGLRAINPASGNPMIMTICGWEAMTKLVRAKNGIQISPSFCGLPYQYEADPK